MNRQERIKLVKAMEYIARQCNDEEVFEYWLCLGVADGDIQYGDLTVEPEESEVDFYIEDDDRFSELMHTFTVLMSKVYKYGGMYCDNVTS